MEIAGLKKVRFQYSDKGGQKGWDGVGTKKKQTEKPVLVQLQECQQMNQHLRETVNDMQKRLNTVNDMQKRLDAEAEGRRKGVAFIQQLQNNLEGLTYGLTLAMMNGRNWRAAYLEADAKLKAQGLQDKTADTVSIAI